MIAAALFVMLAQAPGPTGPPSPLFGGVPSGTATAGALPLTLAQAIDRALEHNLAIVLAEQGVRSARGTRGEALGDVLPHLTGRLSGVRQQINLEAFGLSG